MESNEAAAETKPELPYKVWPDGTCDCLYFGPSQGVIIGEFASLAEITTGLDKEKFLKCGDFLHEFILDFVRHKEKEDMATFVDDGRSNSHTPHPEGLWAAVCSGVKDLGLMKTQFSDAPKRQVVLSFQLGDTHHRDDGKRFTLQRRYTASLNERAALRKDLDLWRGRKFTAAELAKFDLDSVIGVNCQLQLVHKALEDGRVFANIQAVLPAAKGEPVLVVTDDVSPVTASQTQDDNVPF